MRAAFFCMFSILFCFSTQAQTIGVTIDVKLSPAGSFKAETAKIKGTAKKTADGVFAENIEVDIQSLKTGVELRDNHLKDRLLVKKYPKAKLINAQGKNGKGTATVEIKGIKKQVKGTYKIIGKALQAEFKMSLAALDVKNVRYMGVGAKDEINITVTVPMK